MKSNPIQNITFSFMQVKIMKIESNSPPPQNSTNITCMKKKAKFKSRLNPKRHDGHLQKKVKIKSRLPLEQHVDHLHKEEGKAQI